MPQIRPLPTELQKIAIDELGEVSNRIADDLSDLKEWIQQQPHLKACVEDQFLVQFLRGSKYSLEKAKEKLNNFYTFSTKYPYLRSADDVDDPIFRKLHRTGCLCLLPIPLNGNGPRIILEQINFGPHDFTTIEICKYIWTMAEITLLNDPYACIQGLVFVMDCSKSTLQHLPLVTPKILIDFVMFCEKALPLRIKKVFDLNCPPFIQTLLNIGLSCTSEKLRSRIHICEGYNVEKFEELFPKKYLPQNFGGENSTIEHICQEFEQVIDEYREYFQRNADCGVDESLRLDEDNIQNSEFGVGGSFRKINVD
ncbi:alpha-tocopherol transfer protein-like [Musca vetustissima]|uniref:alpha-tocopherol transfer protein-like n=1 Tax=Musca vetustissima TaxID=27455 RepID=UPI002AB6A0C4|nr:alpha-tocopherol transfer protein-like [Musca vetustissima]